MVKRYRHLLSPVQVGGIIFKNRMFAAAGQPHHIQGGENYPTDIMFARYENIAKNQAAAVTITDLSFGSGPQFPKSNKIELKESPNHSMSFDLTDENCQNYICHLIDALHFYGAKAVSYLPGIRVPMHEGEPEHREMEARTNDEGEPDDTPMGSMKDGKLLMPGDIDINQFDDNFVQRYMDVVAEYAAFLKKIGFDMISVHCAYRGMPSAQLLTPLLNKRTDKWGGPLENRARFLLTLFDTIKQVNGRDYPVDAVISGVEEFDPNGFSLKDICDLSHLCKGKIDMLTIRHGEIDPQHPTGFTSSPGNPTPNLYVCEAIKVGNPDVVVAASAGFRDPTYNDNVIAQNKCDVLAMCRAWICDPEYGTKILEGRGEDTVPCIRCNKCHMPNGSDLFRGVCSVNPEIGIEEKVARMKTAPARSKKIGVVGGGPAGMQAALVAAKRGHKVTLFEEKPVLGGQLLHADYASFKWPLRDYKNYMIGQLQKSGVDIHVNTKASRELLEKNQFDDVIIAIGPRFTKPGIPGEDGPKVYFAESVYGDLEKLGKRVVIIGGSETGTETGIYLGENGIENYVMCRQKKLSMDAPHAHYVNMLRGAFDKTELAHAVTRVKRYVEITQTGVVYIDHNDQKVTIPCDSVVLATGAKGRPEAMIAFNSDLYNTYYIGDCDTPGNVQKANRAGYGIASTL